VGPPPPGATRELGILAMQLSPIDIRLVGRFVNANEASLFTQVRGRGILRSSPQGLPGGIMLRVVRGVPPLKGSGVGKENPRVGAPDGETVSPVI